MNRVGGVLLFALLMVAALVVTQAKLTPQERGALLQNVNLVLLLNDAEDIAHAKQGHFVAFAELVKSGALEEAARGPYARIFTQLDLKQETEPLPGFDLGIVVSADGAAYKLSLAQKSKCGKVFFSDQKKQIYLGQPLECPAD